MSAERSIPGYLRLVRQSEMTGDDIERTVRDYRAAAEIAANESDRAAFRRLMVLNLLVHQTPERGALSVREIADHFVAAGWRLPDRKLPRTVQHQSTDLVDKEGRTMPPETNPHDWYAALNESRREAREHTDTLARELGGHSRDDRAEILARIDGSQQLILDQIKQISVDVSNTRTELHTDIEGLRQTAETNAREIVKINTFGRAFLIVLTIVGVASAVFGAIAAFN